MYKPVSADSLYKSYKNYEAYVAAEVKVGKLDNNTARKLLTSAKRNYSNQNVNRQMDTLNAS